MIEQLMREEIIKIIDDNSGGLKFTELFTHLVIRHKNLDPADILKTIQGIPNLGILEYVMDLGCGTARAKQFIYRRMLDE